ncbi:MAG: hypothetical protein FJ029_08100 [Actinobacteria bacterium]|nr:hypothetical protein [Actinomycetota bacterium]
MADANGSPAGGASVGPSNGDAQPGAGKPADPRRIVVRLVRGCDPQADIERLRRLERSSRQHAGAVPLELQVEAHGVVTRLLWKRPVNGGLELRADLERAFGPASVVVKE